MSHLDPSLVDLRTVADHPLIGNGETSSLRMVAPGSATAGRYGLVEYRLAPQSPGRTLTPEEMTAFYARHDQVMIDP